MSVDLAIAARIVELMNEALALDPVAVRKLCGRRVECNRALADHPTIQVRSNGMRYAVGMLGVLNGIAGADEDGWGHVVAVFNDHGGIDRFVVGEGKPRQEP